MWFKMDSGTLQDPKILSLILRRDGSKYFLLWMGILSKAAESVEPGVLLLGAGLPMEQAVLAQICSQSRCVTSRALDVMEGLGLIARREDGAYFVVNFAKHQSVETLEKMNMGETELRAEQRREQNRKAAQRYREKQKASATVIKTSSSRHQAVSRNVSPIEIEDKENNITNTSNPMKQVLDMGDQLHVPQKAIDQLKQQYHSEYVERKARELLTYAQGNPDKPKYNSSKALGKRLAEWIERGDNNGAEPPPEAEHITAKKAEQAIKRQWELRREREEREAAQRRAEAREYATARGIPPPRTEQDVIRLCKLASGLQIAALLQDLGKRKQMEPGYG